MKAKVTCAIWREPGAQCEEEKSRSITSREVVFLSSIHGAKDRCGEQTPRASLHTEEASNRTETTGVVDAIEGAGTSRGSFHADGGDVQSLRKERRWIREPEEHSNVGAAIRDTAWW
jgi:hypothetical protein